MEKIIKMTMDNYLDCYEVESKAFKNSWSEKQIKEEAENPLANYFILYHNDKPIAYAGLLKIVDEGHITNIAVIPEYQGKGYGNLLMEKLIAFKEENKLSFLTLEVRENNLRAINLYKKYNFKVKGRRKKYYDNIYDAVIFSLD